MPCDSNTPIKQLHWFLALLLSRLILIGKHSNEYSCTWRELDLGAQAKVGMQTVREVIRLGTERADRGGCCLEGTPRGGGC